MIVMHAVGSVSTDASKLLPHDSLAYAQECLRLAPHSAEAFLRVGNCMRVMGDLPAAASAYERALACSRGGGSGTEEGEEEQEGYVDLYATLGARVLLV